MSVLHEDLVVIDGLIVANWSPEVFRDMRRGGITAANCTCCVWEGFAATMANVARWNGWFRDHGDLILKARTAADIRRAKAEGRTAIILGFQNTSAFEDRLGAVQLFKDAGVGIAQLTYNTQNFAGSGCYESRDSGLSDWGRELVAEMNRAGMLIDLSHVGSRTSDDTIRESAKPVAYTHCCPSALKPHPRNKSDAELRFIADQGGMIGVTMFPAFLPRGFESTVDDYVKAMEHVISVAGEDSVASAPWTTRLVTGDGAGGNRDYRRHPQPDAPWSAPAGRAIRKIRELAALPRRASGGSKKEPENEEISNVANTSTDFTRRQSKFYGRREQSSLRHSNYLLLLTESSVLDHHSGDKGDARSTSLQNLYHYFQMNL